MLVVVVGYLEKFGAWHSSLQFIFTREWFIIRLSVLLVLNADVDWGRWLEVASVGSQSEEIEHENPPRC